MEQYNDDNTIIEISSTTSPTTPRTDYSNMDSPTPKSYNYNGTNNGNYLPNINNMNNNGNFSPNYNMNNNNNNNMNNFANINNNAFPANYYDYNANVNNNVNVNNNFNDNNNTNIHNNNNNNMGMNYFKYNDSKYKPKLLPKIKAKQLNPLNESKLTKQGKLPSPVLTKMNSKEWSNDNFDVYEKELKEQINHLRKMSADSILKYIQIEPKSSKKKKNKHKRHSSLTFNNSHEWSNREMTQYEHDMLSEFNHLANQIKEINQATSTYYQ